MRVTGQRLFNHLYKIDNGLRDAWDKYDDNTKELYLNFYEEIVDIYNSKTDEDIIGENTKAYIKIKKEFSLVQEKTIDYEMIPNDYRLLLYSPEKQNELYIKNHSKIEKYLAGSKLKNYLFYGGIKTLESIKAKIHILNNDSPIKKNVADIWDVIRYRICFEKLDDIIRFSFILWKMETSNIIKCRNYYWIPKGDNHIDGYRGIHFLIRDGAGGIFELQLITKYRDAVSLLDHSSLFKNSVQVDNIYKKVLINMSLLFNYKESEEICEIEF